MRKFLWLFPAILVTLALFTVVATKPISPILWVALGFAWFTALLRALPHLARILRPVQAQPALVWLLWLIGLGCLLWGWIVVYQPAAGFDFAGYEVIYLLAGSFALLCLPTAGLDAEQRKNASDKLGVWSGPLITLTTLLLIVFAVEFSLRHFVVMSDNFAFSHMHQTWSRLYWNPLNELNYRDYPPATDGNKTNILVAGDSLASGYGVNRIDDTFPHLLGGILGDDVTVNVVAQPGWGISTALDALRDYPVEPDVIVLSHYINDIAEGPAGQQYGRGFPQIRLEPPEGREWWVDHFFIANFLWYRVFLYNTYDSLNLYNDWILSAYQDGAVWTAYQDELQYAIDLAASYDAQLVVLVWPNLIDIEGTRRVTDSIVNFYESRSIGLVDMGDHLLDTEPNRRIVNPFDAHPSAYSHRIAAQQLAEIIRP